MHKFAFSLIVSISAVITACGGGGSSDPTGLTVTSSSWTNGGVIPVAYSSTGGAANTSPALEISNVPANANFLSVVMDDETSPCGTGTNACTHWAVINLPKTKVSITENEVLTGIATAIGRNYAGNNEYAGPNPPNQHTYKLTVYAHSTASTFVTGDFITRADFVSQMGSAIIESATWTGTYTP